MSRDDVLAAVVALVPVLVPDRPVLLGVDGVDGSGKTIFADALRDALVAAGRPVVRVSLDDFHQPRSVRYRRGRSSPEGFWLDSYDYERFRTDVLAPLRPGGSRRCRLAAHDVVTDRPVEPPAVLVPPRAAVVVDGMFLHRDELVAVWDLSVFLDVPFAETARRMVLRDGTPTDPADPGMRRYVEGQRRYFAACEPWERATILVDNTDVERPVLIRHAASPRRGRVPEPSSESAGRPLSGPVLSSAVTAGEGGTESSAGGGDAPAASEMPTGGDVSA